MHLRLASQVQPDGQAGLVALQWHLPSVGSQASPVMAQATPAQASTWQALVVGSQTLPPVHESGDVVHTQPPLVGSQLGVSPAHVLPLQGSGAAHWPVESSHVEPEAQ
jgi:hypothetical protein